MILQGLELTIVGMGVVFLFLTILVFVMKFLSNILPRIFPDSVSDGKTTLKSSQSGPAVQAAAVPATAQAVSSNEAEIAAVIAAIKSYS